MSTLIPTHLRPWSTPHPQYAPVDVTPPELQTDGIAASVVQGWVTDITTDPTTIDYTGRQAVALVPFEVLGGYPLNPAGRTGRVGRDLGRWGENPAADPIVIAGDGPDRQVLLIRRSDCGQWAIPGGMVDPGETAPAALVRELREEAGVDLTQVRPVALARTFVDDPRNTDHAWVCSTVALFQVSRQVEATAGDDAVDARWFPLDGIDHLCRGLVEAGGELYPAHLPLLAMATIVAGGGQ